MARQRTNGFTLAEALLCMLLLCIAFLCTSAVDASPSLSVFMSSLQERCTAASARAQTLRSRQIVEIFPTYLIDENTRIDFPTGIACEPAAISFNASGNISKAMTLSCWTKTQSQNLVFQLGCGRSSVRLAMLADQPFPVTNAENKNV